jgi:hypothetical protein
MKMNKKLLIPLFAFVGLALVSAFLVNYLSNTAKINVDVRSPMDVEFSTDSESWTDDLTLPETYGGSYISFAAKVKNLGNVEIIAPVLKVKLETDGTGATCEDVTSIKFIDTWCHGELSTDCPEQELVGVIDCEDAVFSIPTVKYKVGQETVYPITVTFANVEPSNYEISAVMEIAPAI